ncbi:MAG: sulfate transporter CysZ [Magnetococcales bacterium]|nr:sulfate transporter CysZ [Magnetococcales bacterium]MBF0150139.1 sulfate transporter CysZ [Magnetococcales bacterium]MBF0172168.1 sulfate transporter CysZ [Magnetococcales bacterium]MBF0347150.1 sulfate transporter CysZ [Magnetococcales bacterium]MBF0630533.1 sulfate transporter CysZ [Magnetococcales bacterium]
MISFLQGAACLVTGMRLVLQPGVRRFVWIPLLLNVVLFAGVMGYGLAWVGDGLAWLNGVLPSWLQWLSWLVVPLLWLGLVLLIYSTFTVVANLLGAPFNSLLAAEVEGVVTGVKPVAEGPGKAIRNELEKIFYMIKSGLVFVVLFIVPVINVVVPLLWLVFCAWMMAVEYGDYPMANHGMEGRVVRRHLRAHWAGSLGFGMAVMVLMMVPGANLLAMPAAVAGATVFWLNMRPSPVDGFGKGFSLPGQGLQAAPPRS